MPIKYQMLGGGGGTDLLVKVVPNVSVTLSKGTYTKTLTANEQGQALFKNLSNGTYTATAQGIDGAQYQKEILIHGAQEEGFATQKVANLPVGSKIKFSSGREFILMKHKAKAHNQNSATLVSEFIQEDFSWTFEINGNPLYNKNTNLQNLLNKYFGELSRYERENVVDFTADGIRTESWGNPTISQRFYLFSLAEFGIDDSVFPENASERNLGFLDMDSRIKRYKNGEAGKYWLRNNHQSEPSITYWYIGPKGGPNSAKNSNSRPTTFTAGIVLGVDISENATVYLDTDGYYRVTDK